MVMDFGFLKDLMMSEIDAHYDHGLCLYVNDPVLSHIVGPEYSEIKTLVKDTGAVFLSSADNPFGAGKLAAIPCVPTAENLAKLWYDSLGSLVYMRSNQRAALSRLRVWETPNCYAEYIP
jgi:6-pyruvoyltetrahydropterin/6-carboxytetrahydropterin synthase